MLSRVLVMILLISLVFSTTVQGEPIHWADREIGDLEAEGIMIAGKDSPASLELQTQLFGATALVLQPTASLTRYQLIYTMVEELQLPALEEQELTNILKDYVDTCEY